MKTIVVRINMKTYRNFRKHFKAEFNESCASYFDRLSKYLEQINREIDKTLIIAQRTHGVEY